MLQRPSQKARDACPVMALTPRFSSASISAPQSFRKAAPSVGRIVRHEAIRLRLITPGARGTAEPPVIRVLTGHPSASDWRAAAANRGK